MAKLLILPSVTGLYRSSCKLGIELLHFAIPRVFFIGAPKAPLYCFQK